MYLLLDHLPIIEAIAQFLDLRDLNNFSRVSRKCAICFIRSKRINYIMIGYVKDDPFSFELIENPTDEFVLKCVKMYPWLLKLVKKQTEKLCLETVKLNGYMLEYVINQTEEICIEAIKTHAFAIFYVKKQTEAICRTVLEINPYFVNYFNPEFRYLYKRRRV